MTILIIDREQNGDAATGTVLLTGAAGFVGGQVMRALAQRHVQARLVLRPGQQTGPGHPQAVEAVVTTPDLFSESAQWWTDVCRGVDTVIHLAWYAESGEYLESARNLDCLAGTLQLAKGAVAGGVRRFIGIGTCFEYDLAEGTVSVDTPLRPTTLYGAAKAATYLALSRWFAQQRREFAWCRLFYLYGEGEDERRLVPYLRARLSHGEPAELTSGSQVRDFLDVRRAGQMIADTALGGEQGAVNICSGVAITVRELAEQIADEYGRRDLLRFGARPDNVFDPPRVVGARGGIGGS